MTDLNTLAAQADAVPDASPEQWAAATAYVTQHAPDLLGMLGMGCE